MNLSSKGSSYGANDADDAPLNLSLKTSAPQSSSPNGNVLDLIMNKSSGKSSDANSIVNNLSNLQNLTAGIGLLAGDSKGEHELFSLPIDSYLHYFKVNLKKDGQEIWVEVFRSRKRIRWLPCLLKVELWALSRNSS